MKKVSRLFALTALLAALGTALAGCSGGSDAAPGAVQGAGRVQMIIQWPEQTRLIPEAARTIRVEVGKDNNSVETKLVPRPPTGQNETTVRFENVPAGQVTVVARALPTDDGRGVVQAEGSLTVVVRAGETTTTPPLTMNSTITELRVTPPENLTLAAGQTKNFTVSAHNAQGAVVLTAPGKFTFALAVTSPTIATLLDAADGDSAASLRGDQPGTAALTITETESGKSQPFNVAVNVPQPTGPRILDLGAVVSGSSVFGGYALTNGLDDARVVGQESPPGIAAIATQYQSGTVFNIGTIGDAGSGTIANDINNSNHVVGTANSQNFGSTIPFFFRDVNGNRQQDSGEMVSLGFVGEAEAINDANVVVGTKIDPAERNGLPFVAANGVVTDLATLGGTQGRALDINAGGVVVGSADLANGQSHATVWLPQGAGYGSPTDLGTLPGSTSSSATAVNADGFIVGNSFVPDPAGGTSQQPRAFVHGGAAGMQAQALPLLNATDRASQAFGINAAGVIVGRINIGVGPTENNNVAVKWTRDQAGNYQVTNLNTLHGTGWNLLSARDINDQGVITGNGINPLGRVRAYLLIP